MKRQTYTITSLAITACRCWYYITIISYNTIVWLFTCLFLFALNSWIDCNMCVNSLFCLLHNTHTRPNYSFYYLLLFVNSNDRLQAKERRNRVPPAASLTGTAMEPTQDDGNLFPVPAVRVRVDNHISICCQEIGSLRESLLPRSFYHLVVYTNLYYSL